MKTTTALSLLAILSSTCSVKAAPPEKKPTAEEAETKAKAWIESLGEKGLVIEDRRVHPEHAGFIGRPIAGSKNTMFVLSDDKYYITLGFEGAVSEDTPLATLRKKFSYIALDKLPTPGLELPGWDVKPRTPTSSIRKGAGAVEFLAAGDRKITFRVKTHFFAVYGRDPSVLVPADAGSPPGSYFQVRERFNLDLKLEAPFEMGK